MRSARSTITGKRRRHTWVLNEHKEERNMKQYEVPEMEIILLNQEDVITASGDDNATEEI